jgi:pimeloyl-ACP methyl ester carboxylesterase
VATFRYGDVSIRYEDTGSGFPVLLLAPGGMRSAIELWENATLNPLREYVDEFRLIAMDQRNAGQSSGPLDAADPWGSYAADQLALLDHLGVEQFHAFGCCIGCSYALGLAERAPGRLASAVLEQPIGIVDENRALFDGLWRDWGQALAERGADVAPDDLEAFGTAMWDGDFVLSVTRDFVRACSTPLLVLPGVDDFHPGPVGREVAALAPRAELVDPWKDEAHVRDAVESVRDFLVARTPAPVG